MKKISNLYSLDLISVNNAINEINLALGQRGEETAEIEESNPLIWDDYTEVPVNEFMKDSISLKDGKCYCLTGMICNTTATDVGIFFNGDTEATKYNIKLIMFTTTSVDGRSENNSLFIRPLAANDTVSFNAIIHYNQIAGRTQMSFQAARDSDNTTFVGHVIYNGNLYGDDISKVSLTSAAVNGIGKNSYVRMWRAY